MKKYFVVLLVLACLAAFSACKKSPVVDVPNTLPETEDRTMADGVYTAQVDTEYAATEGHNWQDTLVVTYENGRIVDAAFESYHLETGAKKSEATAEEYPMPTLPSVWIPQLNNNIIAAENSATVDVVAGATYASENARILLAAIETEGIAGQTITVVIDSGASK